MERFGYPDHFLASADDLINGQYKDRPQLRPIFDTIIDAAARFGDVTLQARKTYVSLVTPRRTFARIQHITKSRVDLALRLEGHKLGRRLQSSKIHKTTPLQSSLAAQAKTKENTYSKRLTVAPHCVWCSAGVRIIEEEGDLSEYNDFADAYRQIGNFVEDLSMTKCIHSALGYLTPVEFEADWWMAQLEQITP